jgi:hypothetical protein
MTRPEERGRHVAGTFTGLVGGSLGGDICFAAAPGWHFCDPEILMQPPRCSRQKSDEITKKAQREKDLELGDLDAS